MVDVLRDNSPGTQRLRAMQGFSQSIGQGLDALRGKMDEKKQAQLEQMMQMRKAAQDQANKEAQFAHEMNLQREKYGFEKELQGSKFENESLQKGNKLAGESQEKLLPFQMGLQTIKEMRNIGSRGNLGRGSSLKGYFGGETAKDRSQYEQLGKSLISLASTIPIRNQQEFKTLAENLYDPSLPDSAREGILDAMESIISRSMQQFQGDQGINQMMGPPQQANKTKPPLSSFHR